MRNLLPYKLFYAIPDILRFFKNVLEYQFGSKLVKVSHSTYSLIVKKSGIRKTRKSVLCRNTFELAQKSKTVPSKLKNMLYNDQK